ncbi:MAG: protein kinase [Planctomycetes bacterium]|nr:protein kinase [Planctomycetota bacterium]
MPKKEQDVDEAGTLMALPERDAACATSATAVGTATGATEFGASTGDASGAGGGAAGSGGSASSATGLSTAAGTPPTGGLQGRSFGRYVVLNELGRGGMGTVYRARQPDLDRDVALKVLSDGETSQEGIRRFFREAQAAARLNHPSIVSVYDVGSVDGKYYIAMEYVEGPTLRKLTKGGKVPVRVVLTVLRDIARGIHYAHQNGIVHRDVKPHNILIQQPPGGEDPFAPGARPGAAPVHLTAKIADFGLAKEIHSRDQLTLSGQILGSPSYMSPEQARGDPSEIDGTSDVYCLGATLYDAVTGKPPFEGENAYRILFQVLNESPRSPRALAPNLHRDVETIILKSLEKDRARRYAGADLFADDLDRFLAGEPILARPPGRVERVVRLLRKQRVLAITVGVAAILLAGLGGYFLDATGRLLASLTETDLARRRAREEGERLRHAAEDAAVARTATERRLAAAEADLETTRAARAAVEAEADKLRGELASAQRALGDSRKANASRSTERDARQRSLEAYHRGLLTKNPERALAEFAKALKEDPLSCETWTASAACYLAVGKAEAAIKDLDQALSVGGPNALFAYYLRAQAWRASGQEARALEDLAEVVKRAPEADLALLEIAELFHGRREFAREVLLLRGVLEAHPESTDALRMLAEAHLAVGKAGEAEDVASRLVDRQPNVGAAFGLRARALLALGNAAGARSDLDMALGLDPSNAEALRLRAGVAAGEGQVATALSDLWLATRIAPADAEARLALARLLAAQGRAEEALPILAPLVTDEAHVPEALALRGQALLAHGDPKEAGHALDLALHFTKPEARSPELWFWRGMAAHYQGEIANALEHYTRALAVSPKFVPALLLRAAAYARQTDSVKAAEDLSRAEKLDRTWGWGYVQGAFLGMDPGARLALLRDLLTLTRANSRCAWPWWARAVLLHRKGDLTDARTEYLRAAEVCSQAPVLFADLAQLHYDRCQYREAREAVERYQRMAARGPFAEWSNDLLTQIGLRVEEAKRRER